MKDICKQVIGLTKDKASDKIKRAGLKCRILREDGESYMGTCDARPDRVNLALEGGIVVSADIG